MARDYLLARGQTVGQERGEGEKVDSEGKESERGRGGWKEERED